MTKDGVTSPAGRRSDITKLVAEGLLLSVIFSLLALYTLRSMYGIDIFWHVKVGEWIVEHGRIPTVDTFSAVAPDRPWTPFQWLYEVLVYGLDELGGFLLLRVSHALLILLGFALLYRAARREVGPALALFVLALGIVLFGDRFRVRPHLFNLVFLMAVLPVLLGSWRRIRWPGILGVGVIGWLWANIHAGGALLMPVTLGGVTAGAILKLFFARARAGGEVGGGLRAAWERRPPELRRDVLAALRLSLVVVVPMLFMPGFLKGVITAFTMYGESVDLIPEWQPATAYFDLLDQRGLLHNLTCGFAPYVLMLLVGGYVVVQVLRKRIADIPWSDILLSALLLYLAHRSLRFVYLGVVPTIVLLRLCRGRLVAAPHRLRALAVAALALTVGWMAVAYHYNIIVQRGSLREAIARVSEHLEPSRFPVESAGFLRDAGAEGRILHLSAWGGYLLYELWPRCSVFSDGRGNFDFIQVGTMVATHRAYHRAESLEQACRLYDFDIVMFPAPVFHELVWDHARWVRIYAGVEHHLPIEVFLRRSDNPDAPFAANLERARAYYAALSDDPRFAPRETQPAEWDSATLKAFEDAAGEFWGRTWLSAPRQERRLARLYERVQTAASPAERIKAHFDAAMVFYTAGALGPARHHLVQAAEIEPTGADPFARRALYYLGFVLYRAGRLGEARELLIRVAGLENVGPSVLRGDEVIRGELLLRAISGE